MVERTGSGTCEWTMRGLSLLGEQTVAISGNQMLARCTDRSIERVLRGVWCAGVGGRSLRESSRSSARRVSSRPTRSATFVCAAMASCATLMA